MKKETVAAIRAGGMKKGDVLGIARIAGIAAAKKAFDRTGVEMEAMVSASVAALTIYDMCKGADKGISIGDVLLLSKNGGRSGVYRRKSSTG